MTNTLVELLREVRHRLSFENIALTAAAITLSGFCLYGVNKAFKDEVIDNGVRGWIAGEIPDIRDAYIQEWGSSVGGETANNPTRNYLGAEEITTFYENPKGTMGRIGDSRQEVYATKAEAREAIREPTAEEMAEASREYESREEANKQ